MWSLYQSHSLGQSSSFSSQPPHFCPESSSPSLAPLAALSEVSQMAAVQQQGQHSYILGDSLSWTMFPQDSTSWPRKCHLRDPLHRWRAPDPSPNQDNTEGPPISKTLYRVRRGFHWDSSLTKTASFSPLPKVRSPTALPNKFPAWESVSRRLLPKELNLWQGWRGIVSATYSQMIQREKKCLLYYISNFSLNLRLFQNLKSNTKLSGESMEEEQDEEKQKKKKVWMGTWFTKKMRPINRQYIQGNKGNKKRWTERNTSVT